MYTKRNSDENETVDSRQHVIPVFESFKNQLDFRPFPSLGTLIIVSTFWGFRSNEANIDLSDAFYQFLAKTRTLRIVEVGG